MERRRLAFGVVALIVAIAAGTVVIAAGGPAGLADGNFLNGDDGDPDDASPTSVDSQNETDTDTETNESANESNGERAAITEDAAELDVPEPGDPYYEASDPDGEWVSYVNPRDEYRDPYLGDGSGKLCVTLLNRSGEPIVGESIPNTSVTVPTGDSLSWHTQADPFVAAFPVTEDARQPFDSDQFGTTDDLPQGDGYLDSHCIEFHGLPEDGEINYGEATVEGEYADSVEVVGYIQRANEAWETDIDPIETAVSYEEAGGGWDYHPGGSHGQAVVVLQLADGADDGSA